MPEQVASVLKAKNERLKIWVGLIALIVTNVVTLGTAITAHTKEEKETTAKAAYKELSSAVEQMSKDNMEIHKDLSNVRGYLAGLSVRREYRSGARKSEKKRVGRLQVQSAPSRPVAKKPAPKPATKPEPAQAAMDELPQMQAHPRQYKPPTIDALKKPRRPPTLRKK
jgi:hypothetical protein